MVLPWFYHGFTTVLLWFYYRFTIRSFTMVLPWFYHGSTMVLPWFYHGFTMVLQWFYYRFTIVLAWVCHGSTMVLPCFYPLSHLLGMLLEGPRYSPSLCRSTGRSSTWAPQFAVPDLTPAALQRAAEAKAGSGCPLGYLALMRLQDSDGQPREFATFFFRRWPKNLSYVSANHSNN